MSISERVKELRGLATETRCLYDDDLHDALIYAADTIEALSAKLETANKELERWHTDKINDKIKNPFAWTSTLCCHNCEHKDEYIEELEAADMERSAEDCGGGWIKISDRVPTMEECQKNDNRFILDDGNRRYGGLFDYQKRCFVQFDFWKGLVEDKCAIAWRPLPNPYNEP